MIESDQSDKEQQDEMSPLAVSNNSVDVNEHGKKRLREEISENQILNVPSKKLCISIDETKSDKYDIENISALHTEEIKDNIKDIKNIDSNKDKMLEESTSEITKDSYVETSNIKNNEISINNETEIKKEKEPNISLDIKQQVINYLI